MAWNRLRSRACLNILAVRERNLAHAAFPGMSTRILATVTCFSILLVASAAPAHLPKRANSDPDVISDLDVCIQQRFLDGKSFGMSRILPFGHRVRQFRPETTKEQQVIERLDAEGYQLGFFLAGRAILNPPPQFTPPTRLGVQGPAFMTRHLKTNELPKPEDLLPEARIALASFETGEGYTIHKDGWSIAMRPLRTTSDRCIACHKSIDPAVKLGDAAGVAMYVYKLEGR